MNPSQTLDPDTAGSDCETGLHLPEGLHFQAAPSADGHALLIHSRTPLSSPMAFTDLRPDSVTGYLALEQYKPFWVRPAIGQCAEQLAALEKQLLFLLWKDKAKYHVMLPLIGHGLRTYLLGDGEQSVDLHVEIDTVHTPGPLAVLAEGDDPYAVLETAAQAASESLGSFRLRVQKPIPPFVDMLGWCTWDAFYHDVDQDKLMTGIQSFADAGLVPPLVILDDGWQSLDDDRRLMRFEPNAEKFPDGLAPVIRQIKQQYDVQMFGVWHTLAGYWQGVSPHGPLAKQYRIEQSASPLRRADGSELPHGNAIAPDDAARFYYDFYAYLRRCGVDLTKVDNQNAQANFAQSPNNRCEMVTRYQQAFQGAAWTYFLGNTIHCMSNRNDVAYNMSATTVWRNSDDYFPRQDDSHQFHVFCNAMNNLWSGLFALPDWDMFWSGHESGAFHAAARAISGGPVYVSDRPGEQNFDLLKKMCTSDGMVLRCNQPALPTRDRLFTDCLHEDRLLKVFNRNATAGVLGLFHCRWHDEPSQRKPITDQYHISDIPTLAAQRCAIFHHQSGQLQISDPQQQHDITVEFRDFELLTMVPLIDGVGLLGLVDKFNGSAAIRSQQWLDPCTVQWELRDGGRIGLVCEHDIHSVTVNHHTVTPSQVDGSAYWIIQTQPGQTILLSLIFNRI